MFVFSALLHSPNGSLNIFINSLHTVFVFVYIISFDVFLFERLPAVGFNKFVYLTIDNSGTNKQNQWLYSGAGFTRWEPLPT